MAARNCGVCSASQAEIQTEALGLSAEEVEQLITVPLEADLLNGVEGVEVIRSESVPGLSSIVLLFAPGTDVYRARQLVEERLTQAHALPNVSSAPTLLQPLSSSNRVLMIGLSSSELSLIEQSVIARWTVRPFLMGVPGVANVAVWGMRDQQLQVQVDPARLRDRGVTLNQVVSTAGNAQVVSPLTFLEASTPGTGGFIETPQQRLQVRHLLEKIADPEELAKVPGRGNRRSVAVGRRRHGCHRPPATDRRRGRQGRARPVPRRGEVPRHQHDRGDRGCRSGTRFAAAGPHRGRRTDTTVFRPADYLSDARRNLATGLLVGGVLMLAAFAAFGFRWRSMVVAAVTVPLSVTTAALVMTWLGHSLNALLLAGLAGAIAVVVDETVAPTEQVIGRLRVRAGVDGGTAAVVRDASAAIRPVLICGSILAVLAVGPAAAVQGRPGAFFASLVGAYLLAVAMALVVALTVTPALTAVLLSRWNAERDRDWRWTAPLSERYSAVAERFGTRLATGPGRGRRAGDRRPGHRPVPPAAAASRVQGPQRVGEARGAAGYVQPGDDGQDRRDGRQAPGVARRRRCRCPRRPRGNRRPRRQRELQQRLGHPDRRCGP